MERLGIK